MVELLWKARVEDVDESTIRLWLKAVGLIYLHVVNLILTPAHIEREYNAYHLLYAVGSQYGCILMKPWMNLGFLRKSRLTNLVMLLF